MSTTPTGIHSTAISISGVSTSGGHHHFQRTRDRIRKIALPDGKEVHIAISPEEAETLRQRLKAINNDEPFDLVISGSPEHLEALNKAHTHHQQRRDTLRAEHGELFDQFENVRSELDALGNELHMLTDHSVALDANFSKYGYDARLRTYDDTTRNGSSASSMIDGEGHEKKDWEAEKRNGRVMKVYKKGSRLTTNMLDAFDSTYTMLVGFYLAARLFMGSYYFLLAGVLPMVRPVMIFHTMITLVSSALWIGSIYVEMPNRLAIIWIAIAYELSSSFMIVTVIRWTKFISKRLGEIVENTFEFYPAMNIEHKTERTNAFVTLVFGYSVVAIIYQNAAENGLNAFYGKAALGLVQAFIFNWIYFELDGADLYQHAIRRSILSSALSKLVLATDCANSPIEALTENYAAKADSEVPIGLRWFYCAGFGIALACMGIISICHDHKEASGREIRLSKKFRMTNRFAVCIIIICLPTAHRLSSLQMISIVTGLVLWVLLFELWGASCPDESLFGEKKRCSYTARCSKKALKGGVLVAPTSEANEAGEKGITFV